MCKPHKMNGDNRWKPKDEARLREFERGPWYVTSTAPVKRWLLT
jgi:hypothetical protein